MYSFLVSLFCTTGGTSSCLYDTVDIDQPFILSYSSIVDSISCFGYNDGSIDLSVSGGTLPYSYVWNTGI